MELGSHVHMQNFAPLSPVMSKPVIALHLLALDKCLGVQTCTSAGPKETFFLHSEKSDRIKIVEHIQRYFCESQVTQFCGFNH